VKEMVRYGVILAVICIIASGLLAGMNSLTKARIMAQAQAEEEGAVKEVMPEGERFQAQRIGDEIAYYKVYDQKDKFIGVVFKASAKGYSSVIETMVGMDRDGSITAIKVLSQNETPGLGSRVSEPEFSGQFSRKDVAGLDKVQAITGATISSQAVINSVRQKAQQMQRVILE